MTSRTSKPYYSSQSTLEGEKLIQVKEDSPSYSQPPMHGENLGEIIKSWLNEKRIPFLTEDESSNLYSTSTDSKNVVVVQMKGLPSKFFVPDEENDGIKKSSYFSSSFSSYPLLSVATTSSSKFNQFINLAASYFTEFDKELKKEENILEEFSSKSTLLNPKWFYNDTKSISSLLNQSNLPIIYSHQLSSTILSSFSTLFSSFQLNFLYSFEMERDLITFFPNILYLEELQKEVTQACSDLSSLPEFKEKSQVLHEIDGLFCEYFHEKDTNSLFFTGKFARQSSPTNSGKYILCIADHPERFGEFSAVLVMFWSSGGLDIVKASPSTSLSSGDIKFESIDPKANFSLRLFTLYPIFSTILKENNEEIKYIEAKEESNNENNNENKSDEEKKDYTEWINLVQKLYINLLDTSESTSESSSESFGKKELEKLILSDDLLTLTGYMKSAQWSGLSETFSPTWPIPRGCFPNELIKNEENQEQENQEREEEVQEDPFVAFPPSLMKVFNKIKKEAMTFHLSILKPNLPSKPSYKFKKAVKPVDISYPLDLCALDCEMCESKKGIELTRLTLIHPIYGVLLDTFCRPINSVVDYLTQFSGVTEESLKDITITIKDIKELLRVLINSDTIIIGHSLESDLKSLQLIHKKIIDTSLLYPHPSSLPYRHSLKKLVKDVLKKDIQENDEGLGHDSIEDSLAPLELVYYKIYFMNILKNNQKEKKRLRDDWSHLIDYSLIELKNYSDYVEFNLKNVDNFILKDKSSNSFSTQFYPTFTFLENLFSTTCYNSLLNSSSSPSSNLPQQISLHYYQSYDKKPESYWEKEGLGYKKEEDINYILELFQESSIYKNSSITFNSKVQEFSQFHEALETITNDLKQYEKKKSTWNIYIVDINLVDLSIDEFDSEGMLKKIKLDEESNENFNEENESNLLIKIENYIKNLLNFLPPSSMFLFLPQLQYFNSNTTSTPTSLVTTNSLRELISKKTRFKWDTTKKKPQVCMHDRTKTNKLGKL